MGNEASGLQWFKNYIGWDYIEPINKCKVNEHIYNIEAASNPCVSWSTPFKISSNASWYKNFLHEDIVRFILNYFKFLCCCLRDLSKNFHFLLVADIKEYNGLLHIDCSNLLNCRCYSIVYIYNPISTSKPFPASGKENPENYTDCNLS